MEKVIIDGDWGGDEMQLASVLLANPAHVQVLGATCVFGNTHHDQVVTNALNILHFLKAGKVKVYPGAACPSDSPPLEGDGAHGSDGIGNVGLETSPAHAQSQHAVGFILEQLRNNPPGTITLTASGPLTNIAEAFRREPDTMRRMKQLVIMGGCTQEMPAYDRPTRQGNITYHAEFNFQQAAADAQTVMQSGLPIVLLPMNCTHQLTLAPQRQQLIAETYQTKPIVKDTLLGMMTAPAAWDAAKFNSAAVMHDIHCAMYVLHPEYYQTARGDVAVTPSDGDETANSMTGHTAFAENADSNTIVAHVITNPDVLFDIFLNSITTCIAPQQQTSRRR